MNFKDIAQRIFIFLAVITSMGTVVHDTKLNKVAAVTAPLVSLSINASSDLESLSHGASHTHVEEVRFAQVTDGVPRMQARDDHRKYLAQKYSSRSSDFFGGSRILWPSV